jgi:hypothetical protein
VTVQRVAADPDTRRMTFDDQLRRAFDTLTAQLHDEVSRQAHAVIDELTAVAQAERDQAVADAIRELPPPPQPVAPEPPPTSADGSPAAERLVTAIRSIDDARTLSEILDTLATYAGHEVDRVAVALVRNGGYTAWRSIGFDPPHDRGDSVELPPDASTIPLAIGGDTVAVLCFQPETGEGHAQSGLAHLALEILARHAARCLESVTAFKAARAALVKPGHRADEISDDSTADDGAAARRYAKLLVSEIKLYHEPEVVAGRRERDLATRLGGEIARARVLYDQRVPAQIRAQTDYFRDELVRTLANGDSTLLQLT